MMVFLKISSRSDCGRYGDSILEFWGQVVVGYGPRIGEFTGSGISLLRELNVGFDNNELPYKQHGCFIGKHFISLNKVLFWLLEMLFLDKKFFLLCV